MTFPQNVQFRVFVSRFYQSTRRVRGDDREAIGANHKASRDWGILNRLDLCSPGLRFRRFFAHPGGSNKCAKMNKCAKLGRSSRKSMEDTTKDVSIA